MLAAVFLVQLKGQQQKKPEAENLS